MEPGYKFMERWAQEELENGNRIKASRIQKVAERMKQSYEEEWEENLKRMMYMY